MSSDLETHNQRNHLSGGEPVYVERPAAGRDTIGLFVSSNHYDLTVECIGRCLSELLNLPVNYVRKFSDLPPVLKKHGSALVIVFDEGMFLTCCDEIRQLCEQALVISLSSNCDAGYVIEVLRVGARAHVPIGAPLKIVVEAARIVLAGGVYLPPPEFMLPGKSREDSTARLYNEEKLTDRQLDVAMEIAKGTPNKIIAKQLKMSESTVKVHVYNIMKRLKVKNRTEIALKLVGSIEGLEMPNVPARFPAPIAREPTLLS